MENSSLTDEPENKTSTGGFAIVIGINFLTSLWIIFINGILILCLWINRQSSWYSYTKGILSIALLDLLVGITILLSLLSLISEININLCLVTMSLAVSSPIASSLNVLRFCIMRLYFNSQPSAKMESSTPVIITQTLSLWTVCLASIMIPFFSWSDKQPVGRCVWKSVFLTMEYKVDLLLLIILGISTVSTTVMLITIFFKLRKTKIKVQPFGQKTEFNVKGNHQNVSPETDIMAVGKHPNHSTENCQTISSVYNGITDEDNDSISICFTGRSDSTLLKVKESKNDTRNKGNTNKDHTRGESETTCSNLKHSTQTDKHEVSCKKTNGLRVNPEIHALFHNQNFSSMKIQPVKETKNKWDERHGQEDNLQSCSEKSTLDEVSYLQPVDVSQLIFRFTSKDGEHKKYKQEQTEVDDIIILSDGHSGSEQNNTVCISKLSQTRTKSTPDLFNRKEDINKDARQNKTKAPTMKTGILAKTRTCNKKDPVTTTTNDSPFKILESSQQSMTRTARLSKKTTTAKHSTRINRLIIITGFLLVLTNLSVLPYILILVMKITNPETEIRGIFPSLSQWFFMLESAINPITYTACIKPLRCALIKLLKCHCHCVFCSVQNPNV